MRPQSKPLRRRRVHVHPLITTSSSSSSSSSDDDESISDIETSSPILSSNDTSAELNEDIDETSKTQAEKYIEMIRELEEKEDMLTGTNYDGTKMSHEVVKFDEDGIGPRDRFVYVEERDCIGCTHCQTTANCTFFMEHEHGRARVFDQTGDDEAKVEEAIDTCPVNCIYYVNWDDLVTLELERRGQYINNWARLVGGQDFLSSKKNNHRTTVMDSGIMRCEDCPGRGCAACPMYGVGENPEYIRKKKLREAKQASMQNDNDRPERTRRML